MGREIVRYSNGDFDYVISVSEDQFFIPPKGYENSRSLWIDAHITNKSAKKHNLKVVSYLSDGRYAKGNVGKEGIGILVELISKFEKWLDREKPDFLTISAYHDDFKQRLRLYDRVLTRNNYRVFDIMNLYNDFSWNRNAPPEIIYCRKDLNCKNKNYDEFYDIFLERGSAYKKYREYKENLKSKYWEY